MASYTCTDYCRLFFPCIYERVIEVSSDNDSESRGMWMLFLHKESPKLDSRQHISVVSRLDSVERKVK